MALSKRSIIGLFVGVSALFALFVWQGLQPILDVLTGAGWSIMLVCAFALPSEMMGAEAWRRLFHPARLPPFIPTLIASWMGSSVNTLLPAVTIGGEVVKARVLSRFGIPGTDCVATIIVNKTVQAIGVLLMGILGLVVLANLTSDLRVVYGVGIGAVLLAVCIAGFVAFQLMGSISFLVRSGAKVTRSRSWKGLVASADLLEKTLREIYGRGWLLFLACALRLGGRLLLVGEVWLAAQLMGQPIGLLECLMLKALVTALRGVSFAVPAGLGIQEGGYVLIGALLGLPAPLMLAISLASRLREILPDVPFLFAWQFMEGRSLWSKRRAVSVESTAD